MARVTTLTQHILQEEKRHHSSSGRLTLLLTHIGEAAKLIASHVRQTGIVDVLGSTGSFNAYGEEIQKLDKFASDTLVEMTLASGEAFAVASEEEEDFVYPKGEKGEYVVFFDPLDGSSAIDSNESIGSIFSIYRMQDKNNSLFQSGRKQVACGYVQYGASVMWVYTTGHGVHGFTYDPAIGSFLLTDPDIKIPSSCKTYSVNEAYAPFFEVGVQSYLGDVKRDGYKLRYIGNVVSDFHRSLMKGGIFLYPATKSKPEGKMRLLFEANPLSMLCEQAGGRAISFLGASCLDVCPSILTQTTPIVLGSSGEVEKFEKYFVS